MLSKYLVTIFVLLSCAIGQSYSQVVQQWANTYYDPADSVDYSFAMALDGSGNIYTTGGCGIYNNYPYFNRFLTIKRNPNGDVQWVRKWSDLYSVATCICADASDNIYVAGTSNRYNGFGPFFVTIKYNSAGDTQWVRESSLYGISEAYARWIAVDAAGNVYVTGTMGGLSENDRFTTVKYNSGGAEQWIRQYDYAHLSDASSLAVDANSNVYVTGLSRDTTAISTNRWSYATIKYNSGGDSLWVKRYPAARNNQLNLTLDADNNVYVYGSPYLIKYNTDGNLQWTKTPGLSLDQVYELTWHCMAIDNSSNIYITGSTAYPTWQFETVKYASNGDSLWGRTYPINSNFPYSLTLDASANVYVTARNYVNFNHTIETFKYNTTGDILWQKTYSDGTSEPYGLSVAADNSGNTYVSGHKLNSNGKREGLTIKYAVCNLSVNAGNDTTILDLGGDHANLSAAVIGGIPPIHYSWSTGDTTQSISVSPTDTTTYYVNLTDASGCTASDSVRVNVFKVACGSNGVLVCQRGHTKCIKLSQLPNALNHGATLGPCSALQPFALYGNYPNPFNPVTAIRFSIPMASHVKLVIYDIIGREVSKIVDENLEAGNYNYDWNGGNFASGIYFYSFTAGDFHETRKMVLIK